MFVYAIFDGKNAAERAAVQITRTVPGARVKQFSPTRPAARGEETAGGGPVMGAADAFYTPYPLSFANAWGGWNPTEHHPDKAASSGRVVLRVQVPDKEAAGRAAALMRRAGGAGVQTDAPRE